MPKRTSECNHNLAFLKQSLDICNATQIKECVLPNYNIVYSDIKEPKANKVCYA